MRFDRSTIDPTPTKQQREMEIRLRSSVRVSFSCFLIVLLVGFLIFAGSSASAENRRPKNVQVALRAKWSGTPLLLEAGYVLAFLIVSRNLVLGNFFFSY